jgi:hypothetical protein
MLAWYLQTVVAGLNPAHHLFLQIKFYWNTAIPICSCVVYDCFHTTMAELSSHDKNHTVLKAESICYLAFYIKK